MTPKSNPNRNRSSPASREPRSAPTFACFGGTAGVHVRGADAATARRGPRPPPPARRPRRLSRFDPESELCALNRDPRAAVPATPLLRSLAAAVRTAAGAERRPGRRDHDRERRARRLPRLARAGEGADRARRAPLWRRRRRAAATPPGRPLALGRRWTRRRARSPPARLRIDSGGIAKGLLADCSPRRWRRPAAYAVDCCGDLRIGGEAGLARTDRGRGPLRRRAGPQLLDGAGAVATSGIGRRCWLGADGRAAHHLVDPGGGEPAYTGLVQVTALAPTALLAEVHAKAALLSGPERAAEWLPTAASWSPTTAASR